MSAARAVQAEGLEDGTRIEGIVRKLSAGFPFLLLLRYVGPVLEKVPLGVYLEID